MVGNLRSQMARLHEDKDNLTLRIQSLESERDQEVRLAVCST